MAWHTKLIHCFGRSLADRRGNRLDFAIVSRIVDRIDADSALRNEFEALEELDVGSRFMQLYDAELNADTESS